MKKLNILYEDSDILVCVKNAGVSSQSERGRALDVTSQINNHLIATGRRGVEPYVVHRLDKPVSGILVYALNKKAAAEWSKQVAEGKFEKSYYAILTAMPSTGMEAHLNHLLARGKYNASKIADEKDIAEGVETKEAILDYKIIRELEFEDKTYYLVDINLKTGRHHQIRVQFAGVDAPIYGDRKYDPDGYLGEKSGLALCSYRLKFKHPATGKVMKYEILPSGSIFSIAF